MCVKSKGTLFLLFAVLLVGEIAGSCLRMHFPASRIWELSFVTHGNGLAEGSFRSIFTEMLFYPLLWLLLFAVIGLTVCAVPSALLFVFLHGVTIGGVLTGLYMYHVLRGFLIAAAFVMPYMFLQTLLFLAAARESLRSSLSLTQALAGKKKECCSLRIYGLRFLILSAGLALLAVLQGFAESRLYPAVIARLMK